MSVNQEIFTEINTLIKYFGNEKDEKYRKVAKNTVGVREGICFKTGEVWTRMKGKNLNCKVNIVATLPTLEH